MPRILWQNTDITWLAALVVLLVIGLLWLGYRHSPLRGWRNNAAPLALARMVPDSQEHPSIPALHRCLEVVTGFNGPSAIVWGDRDPVLGRIRTFLNACCHTRR